MGLASQDHRFVDVRRDHGAGHGVGEHARGELGRDVLDPLGLGDQPVRGLERRAAPDVDAAAEVMGRRAQEWVVDRWQHLVDQFHGAQRAAGELPCLGRAEAPANAFLAGRCELGRPLEGRGGLGVPRAIAGVARGGVELLGDLRVRPERRRRQVPRTSHRRMRVRVAVQRLRERPVRRATLCRRGAVIDGGPHQRLPEPQHARVEHDQVGGLRGLERARVQLEHREGGQDRLHRRRPAGRDQQQRRARLDRQGRDAAQECTLGSRPRAQRVVERLAA